MSAVELVVTDTRIWARGPATHWDLPPSVVLGSTGDLIVGESLTPPTQVSSAVQFIEADRIALLPRVPTVTESMAAVVGAVLRNLDVATPCDQVTIVCPTEWDARRRAVVEAAVRRFAVEIVFEDMAFRAVAVDTVSSRARRTVVLEFGSLATTATALVRTQHGIQIESCEHEPNLALADLGPTTNAAEELSALIGLVLAGQPTDVVLVVGVSDPSKLELIRSAAQQANESEVDLRPLAGPDLIRGSQQQPEYRPEIAPTMPAQEWMQPLRQRAAAIQPAKSRIPIYLGGAAVLGVVGAVVAGFVVFGSRSDEANAVASQTTTAVTTSMPVAASPLPTTPARPTTETFGRLQLAIPSGWHLVTSTDPAKPRIDLVPDSGDKERLTLIQTPVTAGSGYDEVAAALEAQAKRRPPGAVSELRRDVVFGGRPGLSYEERPGDGSTVRWHVLVEHDLQVSIGCQYLSDRWQPISGACEQLVRDVRVVR